VRTPAVTCRVAILLKMSIWCDAVASYPVVVKRRVAFMGRVNGRVYAVVSLEVSKLQSKHHHTLRFGCY